MLNEGGVPRLRVGASATISVDAETGLLTFTEQAKEPQLTIITDSEEQLLDHLICHLAAGPGQLAPRNADAALNMLVGHTMESIERQLIQHTLRRCNGNRTHAAAILGIAPRTLRSKLRSDLKVRAE